MNRPLQRAEIEKFASLLAEKRRRQAKALHRTRGYRDKAGVWRGGLLEFVRYFWHILEPGTPFVDGMAMEAMCQHLEAVTYGEITKLLMNVSPGFSKSILTDVMWPAFEWGPMNMPHLRYVAFSYSSSLTERDNLKFRDLITSDEYQAMYGDHVNIRKMGETKVSNWKHGWKLASSVGGVGTGERGDRIICLPEYAKVLTSDGWLPIGAIVHQRLDVSIAGVDHKAGRLRWQEIGAYEANPSGELIEIEHEEGLLRCTIDHPVYVHGRGYVRADTINSGEALWALRPNTMPTVRSDHQAQTEPHADILQQALPIHLGAGRCAHGEQQAMRHVREAGLCSASPSCSPQGTTILQHALLWRSQSRSEESGLPHGSRILRMQGLWRDICPQERGSIARQCRVLFDKMCDKSQMDCWKVATAFSQALRSLREAVSASFASHFLLFERLRQCSAFSPNAWCWEWTLCPRRGADGLSPWPGPDEFDHGLQVLPRLDAWRSELPEGLERTVVRSVRRVGAIAATFNIRVQPCHNYFADGVLVHNCDDPHNVKESESKVVRQETIRWFRESMSSRLNDMENGAKVVIMQRVNEEDVAGEIIGKMDGWCHLLLPMEFVWTAEENGDPPANDIGWVDPRWRERPEDCDGELAWEERFPARIIPGMKRDIGPFGWHAQYQQTPEVRGGAIFEREWWQPWEPADGKFPVFSYIVVSCDSAFGQKENSDPSAAVALGIFENEHGFNRVMVIEAWRRNLKFSGPKVNPLPGEKGMAFLERQRKSWGLVEWLADTCTRRKADRLLIENKASGISAAQSLANSHPHAGWAVQLVEPKGDKWARAQSVQPTFSQEMVYIPWPLRQWGADLVDEMAVFPKGANDDQCDAMCQGIKHLRDIGLLRNDSEIRQDLVEAAKPKGRQKKLYPGTAGKAA